MQGNGDMSLQPTPEILAGAAEPAPGRDHSWHRPGGENGRKDSGAVAAHSRFVAWTKVLLPVIALLLVTLVVAWPHIRLQDTRFRLGFSAIKTDNVDDPAMINPRYFGTDKNAQTFSVTADLAKNLLQGGKSIELERPKADISLEDGTWLVVTANTGYYKRGAATLQLRGDVNVFHDSGYEFRTESADVDLNAGAASGDVPVEGQGPFGNLKAEGFRLQDKGKTIYFTGKSKLVIYPGASGGGL